MSQSSLPGQHPFVDLGEDLGHDIDENLGDDLDEEIGVDYYQTASTLPFCSRQSWFIKDR